MGKYFLFFICTYMIMKLAKVYIVIYLLSPKTGHETGGGLLENDGLCGVVGGAGVAVKRGQRV
jgi:hypothetical protein